MTAPKPMRYAVILAALFLAACSDGVLKEWRGQEQSLLACYEFGGLGTRRAVIQTEKAIYTVGDAFLSCARRGSVHEAVFAWGPFKHDALCMDSVCYQVLARVDR